MKLSFVVNIFLLLGSGLSLPVDPGSTAIGAPTAQQPPAQPQPPAQQGGDQAVSPPPPGKESNPAEREALLKTALEHDQFEFIFRIGSKGENFKKRFGDLRTKDFPSDTAFDPKNDAAIVEPPHEGNGLSANR